MSQSHLLPDNWLENNLFDASYLTNQLPNEPHFNQDVAELFNDKLIFAIKN
jgi:hypothetical protein